MRAITLKITLIALLALSVLSTVIPAQAYADDKVLTIGLIPEENIFRMVRRYRPLGDYLSDAMGIKVRFTILSRYSDIIDRFSSRKLDGAFFGVFASALAHRQLGTEATVRPDMLDGGATSHSYIFVRKDSGIRTAGDMKGKRFAFVDKATATGYVYAIVYMRENGISNPMSYIGEAIFTGSHDASMYTVLSGKADIGVAKGRIYDALSKTDPTINEELMVISKSTDLPDTTLCLRGDLPEHIKKRLSSVLLSMNNDPRGVEILKGIGARRFIQADPADQLIIDRFVAKAGIDIRTFVVK